MKKVVLLGDSIRMIGYGKPVEQALSGDFEVWQPSDNCRYATYTLRGLFDWKREMEQTDIIHWNNGLWDVCDLLGDGTFTPIDVYVESMVRIAKLMLQRAKVVIFATTTPVREGHRHNRNADIRAFNDALVPRLRALGVQINDLYALVAADIPRYICDDMIHLSEEGIALCAAQVERAIRTAAEELKQ